MDGSDVTLTIIVTAIVGLLLLYFIIKAAVRSAVRTAMVDSYDLLRTTVAEAIGDAADDGEA
jgi:hypothetical protein